MRKFEVISAYKDENINLPKRSTKHSAGYDIEAAETVTIPSIWSLQRRNFRMKESHEQMLKGALQSSLDFLDTDHLTAEVSGLVSDHKKALERLKIKGSLVKTGLKVYCNDDEYVSLVSRSSNFNKLGLMLANNYGVIDSDYADNPDNEGHVMFNFVNFGFENVTIKKGDRIGQAIFQKFLTTDDDNADGERLSGFGSTGN